MGFKNFVDEAAAAVEKTGGGGGGTAGEVFGVGEIPEKIEADNDQEANGQ